MPSWRTCLSTYCKDGSQSLRGLPRVSLPASVQGPVLLSPSSGGLPVEEERVGRSAVSPRPAPSGLPWPRRTIAGGQDAAVPVSGVPLSEAPVSSVPVSGGPVSVSVSLLVFVQPLNSKPRATHMSWVLGSKG
jgi:hypothetical protein